MTTVAIADALRAAIRRIAWVGFLGIACSPSLDSDPPMFQRLLTANSPATLGSETRLSTGATPVVVLYGDFDSGRKVPELVGIPAPLANAPHIVLSRRVWRRTQNGREGDGQVRTGPVEVDRSQRPVRARQRDLGPIEIDSPISVQIVGYPLGESATSASATVDLGDNFLLDVGFGIREEAWGPDAQPVQFEVTVSAEAGEERTLFSRTLSPAAVADRRWFDERVDLAAFSGRTVTLDFRTTRRGGIDGYSLPVWSDPVLFSSARTGARPNLVLISIDTLRARSLGTYGYGRDTSPFFDSIAKEGSLFEQAITASVTTSPAHMSLFTGLYPVNHGIRKGLDRKFPQVGTLAEHLRASGYRTGAFTENGYLVRRRGFGDGFDQYTENHGEMKQAPGEAPLTFGQARRWIDHHRGLPFFLFIHTYEVHSPYDPEDPHAELFDGDDAPGPANASVRAARDRYDREIRSVDDELRALFATLEEGDLSESTLVVIVADHGEEFSEHGLFQHGGSVFDESLHVPLLFWGPGRIPEARRHSEPVSLIDVMPTILDLLELPVPKATDGVSLKKPLLSGEMPPSRPIFAEAQATERWTSPVRREAWNPPLFAVRLGNDKFIVHRPPQGSASPMQRFDLSSDPAEQNPLPVSASQAREIDALLSRHDRRTAGGGADVEAVDPVDNADLLSRLRALGYAE